MKGTSHPPITRRRLSKRLQAAVARLLRQFGVEIRLTTKQPPTHHEATLDAVAPYTMTDRERVLGLCDAVEYVVDSGIEGAIVECGVWRGGSMMAAALTLSRKGETDRDLYLFDTFDGMVEPSDYDINYQGVEAKAEWIASSPRSTGSDWCNASLEEVRQAMALTGYPTDHIHYIEGMVEETIPDKAPPDIAILRLDVDWYIATAHALAHLAGRVVDGGVVIFDDYVHWEGARRATDEWVAGWPHPIFLSRVGGWGRIAVIQRGRLKAKAPTTNRLPAKDRPSNNAGISDS